MNSTAKYLIICTIGGFVVGSVLTGLIAWQLHKPPAVVTVPTNSTGTTTITDGQLPDGTIIPPESDVTFNLSKLQREKKNLLIELGKLKKDLELLAADDAADSSNLSVLAKDKTALQRDRDLKAARNKELQARIVSLTTKIDGLSKTIEQLSQGTIEFKKSGLVFRPGVFVGAGYGNSRFYTGQVESAEKQIYLDAALQAKLYYKYPWSCGLQQSFLRPKTGLWVSRHVQDFTGWRNLELEFSVTRNNYGSKFFDLEQFDARLGLGVDF